MFILIMSFPPSTFWLCNQNQDSDEDAYDEGSESESGNDGDPNAGSSGIHHPAPPVEPCVEPRVEPHVVEPPVEPRVEPPVEPRVEPHVEPRVEPHVEPVPLEGRSSTKCCSRGAFFANSCQCWRWEVGKPETKTNSSRSHQSPEVEVRNPLKPSGPRSWHNWQSYFAFLFPKLLICCVTTMNYSY